MEVVFPASLNVLLTQFTMMSSFAFWPSPRSSRTLRVYLREVAEESHSAFYGEKCKHQKYTSCPFLSQRFHGVSKIAQWLKQPDACMSDKVNLIPTWWMVKIIPQNLISLGGSCMSLAIVTCSHTYSSYICIENIYLHKISICTHTIKGTLCKEPCFCMCVCVCVYQGRVGEIA